LRRENSMGFLLRVYFTLPRWEFEKKINSHNCLNKLAA
jgi:hypothetical protein